MKYDLTKDQIEKLNKAIDLARGFSSCNYIDFGELCCVIAQLAVIEGIPLSRFFENNRSIEAYFREGYFEELKTAYPKELLIDLQSIWDSANFSLTEEAAREAMRQLVKIFSYEIRPNPRPT